MMECYRILSQLSNLWSTHTNIYTSKNYELLTLTLTLTFFFFVVVVVTFLVLGPSVPFSFSFRLEAADRRAAAELVEDVVKLAMAEDEKLAKLYPLAEQLLNGGLGRWWW